MKKTAQLRELIERDEILMLPAAMDALTARVIDTVGFDALVVGGYSTSISKIGYPDAGFITLTEMTNNCHLIDETVDIPVMADADTGYGSATNVIRTVREFVSAGVAGIILEDQKAPKRCGHVKGKEVVSIEEAAGKIRAATDARDERNEDFVIVGRTDALGAAGGSLEDAIERANIYCDEGADMAFVEGPTEIEQVERIGEEVDAPLLYNCYDLSPKLEPGELQDFGYDVVLYTLAMHAATVGMFEHAQKLKEEGTNAISDLENQVEELPIESFYRWSGFAEVAEWEKDYFPEADLEKYEDSIGEEISD